MLNPLVSYSRLDLDAKMLPYLVMGMLLPFEFGHQSPFHALRS